MKLKADMWDCSIIYISETPAEKYKEGEEMQ